MFESFGRYETACKGKKKFKSEDDARVAAKDLRKRIGSKVKPYLCSHCGFIHIGHQRQGLHTTKVQKSIDKYSNV